MGLHDVKKTFLHNKIPKWRDRLQNGIKSGSYTYDREYLKYILKISKTINQNR